MCTVPQCPKMALMHVLFLLMECYVAKLCFSQDIFLSDTICTLFEKQPCGVIENMERRSRDLDEKLERIRTIAIRQVGSKGTPKLNLPRETHVCSEYAKDPCSFLFNIETQLGDLEVKLSMLGKQLNYYPVEIQESTYTKHSIQQVCHGLIQEPCDQLIVFHHRFSTLESWIRKLEQHQFTRKTDTPLDCLDILKQGYKQDAVYTIYPRRTSGVDVFCDMTTDGGGWTVFQRRKDGSDNFYRGWQDYKTGFGTLTNEFWLGNDNIHYISSLGDTELRIDMEKFSHATQYAKYNLFKIGDERSKYILQISGYSGTAGDSMRYHSGRMFTTKDQDHDQSSANCAVEYKGAWWYNGCYYSNLNGLYYDERVAVNPHPNGIIWDPLYSYLSLKSTTMMMRRKV